MNMKLIEPDYNYLLEMAHRRWIVERTPEAAQAFDRALLIAIKAGRDKVLKAPEAAATRNKGIAP